MERLSHEQFAALYGRTFRYVRDILCRLGIHEPDREDLAQRIYEVAYSKSGERDLRVPEGAWICTIAYFVAWRYRDLARHQKEIFVSDEPPEDGPTVEDRLAQLRRFHLLVKDMPDGRRIVFDMHEIDGYTLPEIAAELEIKVSSAATRLRLAREHVEAAAARLEAKEAHAEGRMPGKLPLLLPFGMGAWGEVMRLFDPPPEGVEQAVWRGVSRRLGFPAPAGNTAPADGAAPVDGGPAGLPAGSSVASKAAAGTLFGAGAVTGVAATIGVLYGLRLLAPAPPPVISSVPETVAVTSAPQAPAAPPGATPVAVPSAAAATVMPVAAPRDGTSPEDAELEEQRILRVARKALDWGSIEAARAALAEHDRRFPPGRTRLPVDVADLQARFDAAIRGSALGPEVPDARAPAHGRSGTED